jgi:hypothetical protein
MFDLAHKFFFHSVESKDYAEKSYLLQYWPNQKIKNKEIFQISKSKPKNYTILCTFNNLFKSLNAT